MTTTAIIKVKGLSKAFYVKHDGMPSVMLNEINEVLEKGRPIDLVEIVDELIEHNDENADYIYIVDIDNGKVEVIKRNKSK